MDSDTTERYDRQIRLWGQHGQNKCSSSKICLINANSLGTEILKGLCLAGVGSFVILDSHKLTPEDVGCNFIPQSCIGKSRGESVKQMLSDLNEDVRGWVYPIETHLPHIAEFKLGEEPSDDIGHDLDFWKQFNCVIACGFLYTDQIIRLSKFCWTTNVPLILCKSIGFFGSMRTQIKEHLIIETHPDNIKPDFNLDHPFKDLKAYFDSIDLEHDSNLDKVSSFPYVVIIYKYLKVWQARNDHPNERLPVSYAEKKELKSIIDEGLKSLSKRRIALKGNEQTIDELMPFENFLEASKAVNSCLNDSSKLPNSVEEIFNNKKIAHGSVQSLSRFWLIIKALREFVFHKNNGRLPISGKIPDMISSSEEYIRLQSIYSKKAREDITSVLALVQNLASSTSNSSNNSLNDDIKLICRNIKDLKMITTDAIYNEYDLKTRNLRSEDEEDEFIAIGLCLKTLDLFYSAYGRLPGHQNDQVEIDIVKLKDCVKQIVGKVSQRLRYLDQCLYEVSRCGGAELHATSAFIGGCIAQEVIKLITNQYVPVDDTLVYNAMTASVRTFKFSDTFFNS